MTDFNISVKNLSVSANNGKYIDLEFSAEDSEVLEHFNLDEIIKYFRVDDILDHIGVEEAKNHFNLIEG